MINLNILRTVSILLSKIAAFESICLLIVLTYSNGCNFNSFPSVASITAFQVAQSNVNTNVSNGINGQCYVTDNKYIKMPSLILIVSTCSKYTLVVHLHLLKSLRTTEDKVNKIKINHKF